MIFLNFFNINKTILVLPLLILLSVTQIQLVLGDSMPTIPEYNSSNDMKDNNPHKSSGAFERYVKDKYINIKHLLSDVKQSQYGPSGTMWINGDIVPHKKTDLSAIQDRHSRARSIAKDFMDDEALLLGITDQNEIREVNIITDKLPKGDRTFIYYKRYINDIELDGVSIDITIGPDEDIKDVHAKFVSISPELYKATKKKTLTEAEIKSIIESDLTEDDKRGYDMNNIVKQFKKVAITKSPYVIWKVFYFNHYQIDAYTGKILKKISPIRREPTPPEPKESDNKKGDTQPPMPPLTLPQK